MNNSDLQLEPKGYIVHLYTTWSKIWDIFTQCSLEIKNAHHPGELIITDGSSTDDIDDIEIPNNKYYFGILKKQFPYEPRGN